MCIKVQSYTKDTYLHKVAVKILAKKNKFVLALKSLLFLQKHHPASEEYLSALIIFEQYYSANSSKIKESVTSVIKTYLPIIFNKAEFESFVNSQKIIIDNNYETGHNNNSLSPFDRSIYLIKNMIYFSGEAKDLQGIEKSIFDALQKDKTILRKIHSEKYLNVVVYLTVFASEETLNRFKVNKIY